MITLMGGWIRTNSFSQTNLQGKNLKALRSAPVCFWRWDLVLPLSSYCHRYGTRPGDGVLPWEGFQALYSVLALRLDCQSCRRLLLFRYTHQYRLSYINIYFLTISSILIHMFNHWKSQRVFTIFVFTLFKVLNCHHFVQYF